MFLNEKLYIIIEEIYMIPTLQILTSTKIMTNLNISFLYLSLHILIFVFSIHNLIKIK